MKILDVGCGMNKHEGAIGLDNNPKTGADVIHDLGQLPYPFPDNEFDTVVSNHAVEHVPDLMAFITELYRITKPGGRIKLITPHYTNPDWATDPTHRNHINSYTFNTFMPDRAMFDFYTDVKLRPVTHTSRFSHSGKPRDRIHRQSRPAIARLSVHAKVLGALSELYFPRERSFIRV